MMFPTQEDEDEMALLGALDEEDKIGFKTNMNAKDGMRKRQVLQGRRDNGRDKSRAEQNLNRAMRDTHSSTREDSVGERKKRANQNAHELRRKLSSVRDSHESELSMSTAIRRQRKYEHKNNH